jgi:hypothetical protein
MIEVFKEESEGAAGQLHCKTHTHRSQNIRENLTMGFRDLGFRGYGLQGHEPGTTAFKAPESNMYTVPCTGAGVVGGGVN